MVLNKNFQHFLSLNMDCSNLCTQYISILAYKIYNNELLKIIQRSDQGVDLGIGCSVSCVGQADDVALLSNDIHCLKNALNLTLNYCRRFHVELCPDKTKLLVMTRNSEETFIPYNPIMINGSVIPFSRQADHVGILRSCDGNSPNLQRRFAAHRRALAANLFVGTARNHRGNLAACVQSEKIYARPVLFSGLASLALSNSETNMIAQHWLTTMRKILKTHPGTPQSVILFISGNLPGAAQLHLKQLSLFSMITRFQNDPLNSRARHVLTARSSSSKSWFFIIRDICLLYSLPHPLQLLTNPIPKDRFRKLARSKVTDYWESRL